MIKHKNLSVLAEKNDALLQKLGFDPQRDNPFELDNPETFRQTGLFSEEAIQYIFREDYNHQQPHQERIPRSIGMLLIRPDMVQIAPQVERFIRTRFRLLNTADTTVTPEIYWAMYADAITNRETRQSRLTRAVVYINSLCRLITFERPETEIDNMAAADHLLAQYKGTQGVKKAGTLRGDLVYKAAVAAGFHTLHTAYAGRIADPFGAYRKIVRTRPDSACQSLEHPLLFFTGVGIHIPNHQEMQRDLLLLTKERNEHQHTSAA